MVRGLFCIFFLFLFSRVPLAAQDSLTVLFAGDAMMHQTQIDNTRSADSFDLSTYFSHISSEIKSADIAVVNLEVVLGGVPYSGYPAFSAPDELAVSLRDAGFNFFLLANNHCLDRGAAGLARTIRLLDSLDIKHTGAYPDRFYRKRSCPFLFRKNGFRIILLNYTYGTNGIRIAGPGGVNYIDKEVMSADLAEAKLFNPDFIIANMHWGAEYSQTPSKEQRHLADWLLMQGADLVIGNHPHVVQPMELREGPGEFSGKLVVYSLGNLISNMDREHANGGALVKVVLCRRGLKRYVSSAGYTLVFADRYRNERGKEDIRVVPAAAWLEKCRADSLRGNYLLDQYIRNTRTLLKLNNIGVEEYFFE